MVNSLLYRTARHGVISCTKYSTECVHCSSVINHVVSIYASTLYVLQAHIIPRGYNNTSRRKILRPIMTIVIVLRHDRISYYTDEHVDRRLRDVGRAVTPDGRQFVPVFFRRVAIVFFKFDLSRNESPPSR